MNFDLFFSEENLVKMLCKYRANTANKRHAKHMLRNVSLHDSTNKIGVTETQFDFIFLQSIFPSRRNWAKLNEEERKTCKDSLKVNQKRLFKSYLNTKKTVQQGSSLPEWYNNLIDFVESLRDDVLNVEISNYKIEKPVIKGIKKEEKNGVVIYRPIALYGIKDKMISSITAKYLTSYFERVFLDCSFAFRGRNAKNEIPNHHDCIEKILNIRKKHPKLWVAECDIQKFFDTVQQEHILSVLNELAQKVEDNFGTALDNKALKIFELFLSSFSFQENILPKNLDIEWFKSNKLPIGRFGWVENELVEAYGKDYIDKHRIGVPQGNAISCFIANLILHSVDEEILKHDKDVFYIRYCDDMILMHTQEEGCKKSLDIYMEGIKKNYLLFHKPKKIINYKSTEESKKFWKLKSKLPFFWGDKNINEVNIPWVSFVGYQINYNGNIRVRKSTIEKEVKKQINESQKVLKALGKFNHYNVVKDANSRVSKTQILFRLQNRLISMSVGRIKIYNHKNPTEQGLCWTNGFKKLSQNKITRKQLRFLDKRRNIQLNRVRREIHEIEKETTSNEFPNELKSIYFGSAFSYYNYLKHK
ncbi:reverse transcriptase domain-containing protein [Flavobacterium artemisiae]|uniref:Reverse transcriptase domain-containing protein n=1 Tax=Flavobacterium artemisiae TaxID=2126556 RepID=A0ABW4HCA1_9FLAO